MKMKSRKRKNMKVEGVGGMKLEMPKTKLSNSINHHKVFQALVIGKNRQLTKKM